MNCKKIKNIWEFSKLFPNTSKVIFRYKRRIWQLKTLIYRFTGIVVWKWKWKFTEESIWFSTEIGILFIFRKKAQFDNRFRL